MSFNKQEYTVLNREQLDNYLNELGKLLKKKVKGKSIQCELIIVGGAAIVFNYGFRLTTEDIDCLDENRVLMNDVIGEIADKYGLPPHWINTNFTQTKSYSNKIIQYSVPYKSYGYGALNVRTIKDEYLVAMKIVSARNYKNDYSDIFGIINECRENKKEITIEMVERAIVDLYGSIDVANPKALEFTKQIILNPNSNTYDNIRQVEKANSVTITSIRDLDQNSIEYILSKLDIE